MKEIVLDADGVILHFEGTFQTAASEILQRRIVPVSNSYDLDLKYGITKEEEIAVWDHFADSGCFSRIEPFPGASIAVRALEKAGYLINIVTGIPEERLNARMDNFQKMGFQPKSIHGVGHGRASKTPKLRDIAPVMFVDDRLEHLHAVPEVPILVWIDHGDEQHPLPGGRVDFRAKSLLEWTSVFLENQAAWLPAPSNKKPNLPRTPS